MEQFIDFLSNKTIWYSLKYPLYHDNAFLLPFIIHLILYFIKDTKAVILFTVKGFHLYAAALIAFSAISYIACSSLDHFVTGQFIKRFLKLLLLYPICRSLKWQHYTNRMSKVKENKDISFNDRLTLGPSTIVKESKFKNSIFGAGLGQENSLISELQKTNSKSVLRSGGVHLSLLTACLNFGYPLTILLLLFFFHIRDKCRILLFLSLSIVGGSFATIPFAMSFILASRRLKYGDCTT